MSKKKRAYPINGKSYSVELFFSELVFEAIFLSTYTDLFGESYDSIFMSEKGKIILLSEVARWERI